MYLTKEEIKLLLNKTDMTETPNYCIGMMINKIKESLHKQYGIIPEIEKGSKIVSLNDNYYSLGYHNNEITLSKKYTKYINENEILRTQMSSVIPSLLKNYNNKEDKLWMCPGMVYRRDIRDKTHVREPHQMDIWYLTKNKQTRKDLLCLVNLIISVIEETKKEKIKWRYNETSHHYTDEGIEVEIYYNNNWLELLECGLISKNLLNNNNLENYSGLALGLGLERLIMLTKDIDDIRVLSSNEPKIKNQLCNLEKYKKVSNQPSIKRDLSIAVDKEINEEELTEIILYQLNENIIKLVESIKVISETLYCDLPEIAIERLGINKTQKNISLRINLQDIEKTLSNEEANNIYTEIYTKIHKGTKGYKII